VIADRTLPDDRFLDSQTENIKKAGTVENAMAYELDDLHTPVDLVATEGLDTVIGRGDLAPTSAPTVVAESLGSPA
jgi:hypothetical protein